MSPKMRLTGTTTKSEFLLPGGCIAACWIAGCPYLYDPWIQLILAVVFGCLLSRSLLSWLKGRRLNFYHEQFRWLLEHLLAKLTAGATLERAFMEASISLGQLLGKKSELLIGLQQLEKQLTARQPLDSSLTKLSLKLPCPEAMLCFQVLPGLRKAGGQVSQFIRQQLRMTTEQLVLKQDINAENAQRQTEAIILAGMPFVMAGLLQKSSDLYANQALTTTFGAIGSILAYGLAMSAAILTIATLANHGSRSSKLYNFSKGQNRVVRFMFYPAKILLHFYQNRLPEAYGIRLLQILQESKQIENQDAQSTWLIYFKYKAFYLLICLIPGLLLIRINPIGWYWLVLLPLLIVLLQDQQVFAFAKQRQQDYRLDYPIFLNLATALLQAGISLHITLKTCTDNLVSGPADRQKSPVGNALQQDLINIKRQLQIGMPADRVLEKMAVKCVLPEAQAAMLLMIRYDQAGGAEILHLLQMQAATCWTIYRNAVRKKLEHLSLRLLLSMTLDLLSVLLTAILPAVLSFKAI